MNELHDIASRPTEALDQILELVVLLNEAATRSLARDGLTLPRAGVVWFVHHNGPSTQRAIADFLKVTPRNVTGLVDALVETGFVTREPHPTDRRATLVSLTDHGATVLARMDREHRELADQLFGTMSEREFRVFAKGLGHVLRVGAGHRRVHLRLADRAAGRAPADPVGPARRADREACHNDARALTK